MKAALFVFLLSSLPYSVLRAQEPPATGSAETYLPKVHGRKWVYQVNFSGVPYLGGDLLHRFLDKQGQVRWRQKGLGAADCLAWQGEVLKLERTEAGYMPLELDFSREKGEAYPSGCLFDSTQQSMVQLHDRNIAIDVPAGHFENCIRFDVTNGLRMLWDSEILWFAPQVGVVRWVVIIKGRVIETRELIRVEDPDPAPAKLTDARTSGRVAILVPGRGEGKEYFLELAERLSRDVYGGKATVIIVGASAEVKDPAADQIYVHYWTTDTTPFVPRSHAGAFDTLIVLSHAGFDGPNLAHHAGGYQPWPICSDENVMHCPNRGFQVWREDLGAMLSSDGKIILRGCSLASPIAFVKQGESYAERAARAAGRPVFAIAASDWMGAEEAVESTHAVEAGQPLKFLIRFEPE